MLWTKYSPSDKVPLGAVVFHMTIKGIAQTCLGDVFEDNAEVDKLSSCYHSCWREMEASINKQFFYFHECETLTEPCPFVLFFQYDNNCSDICSIAAYEKV